MAGAGGVGIGADRPKKLRNATLTALWTSGPPPPEYTDLVLCRDVFHCTPSELAAQDADDILTTLALLEAEAMHRKAQEAGRGR